LQNRSFSQASKVVRRQGQAGRIKTTGKIGPRYRQAWLTCLLVVAVTHRQGHSSVQPVITDSTVEAAAAVDANIFFKMLKGTKANDMVMVVIDTRAPNQDTTILTPGIAHRLPTPATAGVIVLDNKMVCVRIMGVNKIPTTALCHHSGAGQYPPIPMIIAHPRTS